MSYVPRTYDAILRDLLTTLTGGTVRETLLAPASEDELLVPVRLQERPVRRISFLEGKIPNPSEPDNREKDIRYRFTDADFELVSSSSDENNKDSIRFREDGRRPAPGTLLTVNYYPVETGPVPITDLNIGSVARTLIETFAREIAVSYLHLEHIYRSAFLDTSEGAALDKVVALVGVSRQRPGQPMAKLRFTRQAGATGQITIPANTAVTDADGNRFLLQHTVTMDPAEASRDTEARGELASTPLVEEGTLTRLETLIAGIGSVTNPEPAYRLTAAETDEALRRRARVALQGSVRGTLPALEDGLRAVEGVKDVSVIEAPNGVPGEIKIDVAYSGDPAAVLPVLQRRVRELRPAGIRVHSIGEAPRRRVRVQVHLTLAGSGVPAADLNRLLRDAKSRLDGYLDSLPPGAAGSGTPVRQAKMMTALLADDRIADAAIEFTEGGRPLPGPLTLGPGEVLEVEAYDFPAPVAETAPAAAAGTSTVHADIPVFPEVGTSLTEAQQAIALAFGSYLATVSPSTPLTVDALRTALRDDTRYAIAAGDVIVTVERFDGTFQQLSLGAGQYVPDVGETLAKGTLSINEPEVAG